MISKLIFKHGWNAKLKEPNQILFLRYLFESFFTEQISWSDFSISQDSKKKSHISEFNLSHGSSQRLQKIISYIQLIKFIPTQS